MRRRWLAALALPLVSLAACGRDDSGGWLTSLLRATPDTASARSFVIANDEAGAEAAFDLEPPADDATDDQRAEFVQDLLLNTDLAVMLAPNHLSGADPFNPIPDGPDVDFLHVTHDLQAGLGGDAVEIVDLEGGRRVTYPSDLDNEPSLADRDDLRSLANALAHEHALTGFLTATTDFGEDGPPGDLDPYDAVAVGGAVGDEDSPLLIVALWHEDRDAAAHNANALRDLAGSDERLSGDTWAEEVQHAEVDRDGALVTGVFTVEDPRLWYEMVNLGSPLLQFDAHAPESPG